MALRAGLNNIMTTLRRRSGEPAAGGNNAAAPVAAYQQAAAPAGPAGPAAAGPAAPLLASVSNATSVTSTGTATGTPTAGPAGVHNPVGVVADGQGNLYVADAGNYRILKLQPDGTTAVVAGGTYGLRDGGPRSCAFLSPAYLALDPSGSKLLVTDQHCVRRVNLDNGMVATIAGSGSAKGHRDGPADVALFHNLRGILVDWDGAIFVADSSNHCIRKITQDGHVITFAGCGQPGYQDGPGKTAQFCHPCGLALYDDGTMLVADSGNNRIRMVDGSGAVSTLAGQGSPGYRDGQGTMAKLHHPQGLAVDGDNNVLLSDLDNHRIRIISPVGVVSTIAGSSSHPGGSTDLDEPGCSSSAAASSSNACSSSGPEVFTLAVGGNSSSKAQHSGSQLLSQQHYPQGVTIDSKGSVIIADGLNSRITKFDTKLAPPSRAKQKVQTPTLSSCLLALLEREELTDVTFMVEGCAMVAHSLVLRARCEYFRTMLGAGMQEEHSRVVYVHDVCASSFRAFLHYLYSDTLALDHYSVLDLLYLSRKYLLHHLTKQCTAYVRAHLSCANALQWLVWAREQVFEDLEQAALDYARQHFVSIRAAYPEALAALTSKPELLLDIMRGAALEGPQQGASGRGAGGGAGMMGQNGAQGGRQQHEEGSWHQGPGGGRGSASSLSRGTL